MPLDARSGEPKWTWQYKDGGNWSAPRVVLADLGGDGTPSVCVSLHESQPKSEIVVLDGRGEVERRIDGGARVENNYAVNTLAMRIWAADVDGDGKDDFVYLTDGKLRATRGGPDESLWEWPLPGGAGGIREIRSVERGKPATIVVEAVGESPFDSLGLAQIASLPPYQGSGQRGDSIYGLDGATGKPIWRGWREPGETATVPARVSFAAPSAEFDRSASQSFSLVSRVARSPADQYAVSRVILQTEPTGEYRSSPVLASVSPAVAADPRLMRRLPWVPHVSSTGLRQHVDLVRPPALMGLYSLVVLVIPAWLLRGVLRRRWTLPSLLLVPVAFAVGFFGYKMMTTLTDHKPWLPDGPVIVQLLAAATGVPLVAFPVLVVAWTVRARWSRLAWLLSASLTLSLAIPAIMLLIDSRGMDPSEHYSWTGWYVIVIMAGYAAALLTLAGMLLARIVQAIRSVIRRLAEAA
jgi:hypothetical protein